MELLRYAITDPRIPARQDAPRYFVLRRNLSPELRLVRLAFRSLLGSLLPLFQAVHETLQLVAVGDPLEA